MRSSTNYLFIFSSISALVSTQNLVPSAASSTFPNCAVSCAALLQAQTACTPPTLPTSSNLNYENCFCQSPSLQALYSTPDAICAAECNQNEADRALLQTWFLGFCQKVGQGIDPLATAPSSTAVVTVTSTSSPSPTDTISSSGTSSSSQQGQQSWLGNHWKWILMLAILLVGLLLLALFAIWFKRRHRRKLEQRRAAASGFPASNEKRKEATRAATPDLWGPHQHMHATKGWEYHSDQENNPVEGIARDTLRKSRRSSKRHHSAKGKDRAQQDIPEINIAPSASRRRSSRSKHHARQEVTEVDEGTRKGTQSRSRSRRDRNIERERSRDQDIERGNLGSRGASYRRDFNDEKI